MNKYPTLLSAVAIEDYFLMLTFEENEKRIYDFKPNLSHKYYKALNDFTLFKTVCVKDGEIEWASGQDFCPHTLYENSKPVI